MIFRTMTAATLAGAVLVALAPASLAEEEGARLPAVTDKLTRTECSACHMPYSASLLPKRSWHAILSDLGNHFGEDASLDAKSEEHIRKWLEANAADTGGNLPAVLRGVSASETPMKISELPIIVRIHKYEVSDRWRKKVGTMGNCNACHRGAADGFY